MCRCPTPPISNASRCRRSRTSSPPRAKWRTVDMSIQILMPALSPTMTEGAVARWLKKEGDEVHSGDVIAEIETDKATMEYEAVDEGRLGKIIVPEGTQGVKVNEPIAVLLEEGEDASALGEVSMGGGEVAATAPPAASSAPAP